MGFLTRKSTFSNLYKFYSETDTKIESIPCVDFLKSKNYRVILVQALIYSITKCKVICNVTPQIDYSTGPRLLFINSRDRKFNNVVDCRSPTPPSTNSSSQDLLCSEECPGSYKSSGQVPMLQNFFSSVILLVKS